MVEFQSHSASRNASASRDSACLNSFQIVPHAVEQLDAAVDVERKTEALLQDWLERQAQLVTERANRGVLAVDELAAQLERHVREFLVVDRPDAPTETLARFEEMHVGTAARSDRARPPTLRVRRR